MERYVLANGEVYEILICSEGRAVAKDGKIILYGTYRECRMFIEQKREDAKLKLI